MTTDSPPTTTLRQTTDEFLATEAIIRQGGGPKAIARQHAKDRLTARERIARLVDQSPTRERGADSASDLHTHEIPNFQELGLWSAHGMYADYGGAPAAGTITGVGIVQGRPHMIIANDATVKAGAFFPMTCKKIIRAQNIARACRLPLIYLVDSAGVFLPMQEDVFPDTDDFGRVFYLNSVISAEGIPQTAAIMGYCVAGGGYLPVLCDTLLMTEGSGLYLAGQALVKAAIGQEATDEELGGATMHAEISGTIDFKEPDDEACINRVRELVGKSRQNEACAHERASDVPTRTGRDGCSCLPPFRDPADIYTLFTDKPGEQYNIKDIIACIVDARTMPNTEGHESLAPDFDEYKADYGLSIVCGYARIGGHAVGIVGNQGSLTTRTMPGGKGGPSKAANMPRVIYDDSADKAARFIMDCNQRKIPIIFLHDTTGFMVGRDSEQGGIIRAGAKLVNAVSNSVVPKLVVIMGGSYGAGNYAMCGRAFEQTISFAWPGAKCSVMGAAQASGTLAMIEERSRIRKGETIDPETHEQILNAVRASYTEQQDIRHAASRGWVDRIIQPHATRDELIAALLATNNWDYSREFRTGVLQT
ncbi:Acetyl-coenzyme A carboxyl transferase alpha chain / Acetyl-coenzyme A carboxyl transferase beta chain; Propionyl-CoA carboxylase beta chain [hydrothermal vent metagenome]|uniref:Acetyl-coenzyme A carboxyl transferase alpha chain / Acetyl-coenzyme A carboxyl transferase beta chain Propionyl-CoA carboxylase beta chain n=1 Tax=hydrothermal vent metagenome TaxID=652676 RepID=A0A3B1DSF8_9ZZZZ